ncbi:MAG: hypothetical protein ACU85V_00030 [Gammaproteobacteria bacterium]
MQADIATWRAAINEVANGSEFSINGRTLKREDLGEMRAQLNYLLRAEAQLLQDADAASGSDRMRAGVGLASF